MRSCLYCHENIERKRRQARFCDDRCRVSYHNARRPEQRRDQVEALGNRCAVSHCAGEARRLWRHAETGDPVLLCDAHHVALSRNRSRGGEAGLEIGSVRGDYRVTSLADYPALW